MEGNVRGEAATAKYRNEEDLASTVGYVAGLKEEAPAVAATVPDAFTAAAELGIDPEEYLEG